MNAAAIRGLCATPKGVRHGFGIKAVTSEVPLNMTQKWLGHARLDTTALYTKVATRTVRAVISPLDRLGMLAASDTT